MKPSPQLRVFLVVTGGLVASSLAWSQYEYWVHADERGAWQVIVPQIEAGQKTIDSLESVLTDLGARVEAKKTHLSRDAARIAHWQGHAVGETFPSPAHREYLRAIDRHNVAVSDHNAVLEKQRRVYAEYSVVVDEHNALVDSANRLQRRAVEEGFQLPSLEP